MYPLFDNSFGDKRIDDRGNRIVNCLSMKCRQSIMQFSSTSAEQKGTYRFLSNESTSLENITAGMSRRCAQAAKGKMVLAISDTTEANLYNHKNRIKPDGSIGLTNASHGGLGFMIHPSLVVDAVDGYPYGFSHVHIYNRGMEREKDKHAYKRQDIALKESNKWMESAQKSKEILAEAEQVIFIQDREGDIYEQFARIPDRRFHLLIRTKSNRKLANGERLFDKVGSAQLQGHYTIEIPADRRRKRKKRIATIEVRYIEFEMQNCSRIAADIAPSVKLYCVEAREINCPHKDPVIWRLTTTLAVTSFEEALQIIEWYSWRWMIEEVFRIMKKEGYDIEASELESGLAIKKLSLLILQAIIRLFQMNIAYEVDDTEAIPACVAFEEQEIVCMEKLEAKLEGKTEKQKNPYKKHSLRWATWIIARLGGWKGYASQRKPGITTLWIGMEKFYTTFEGWCLLKDVSTR